MSAGARRRALVLGYVQGALWSAGNGLTTGTLILYLAQELGAKGTSLSLLIAAPSLIGLLRLVTPSLIAPLGGIKATCLKSLGMSYVLLAAGLPAVTLASGSLRETTLAAMIGLICVHQLLEYVGGVALWSWLAELAPVQIRGRYLGRRQMWQMVLLIPALLASGLFTDHWKKTYRDTEPERVLLGYVIPSSVGTGFLLASLIPLLLMPSVAQPSLQSRTAATRRWPIRDARFRRYLIYRVWFSFFNGITQAALNIYVYVLGIGVLPMQLMQLGMRAGQLALSPAVGRAADSVGNRPVLELSQLVVALGPLFYFLASRERPWWIVGAWVVWTAYAGMNVCLTNLMLKLAPARDNAGYIASFEALGGLAYGLSTISGGVAFDRLRDAKFRVALDVIEIDHFALLFLVGVAARALGVVWLARVDEPGAIGWPAIITANRKTP